MVWKKYFEPTFIIPDIRSPSKEVILKIPFEMTSKLGDLIFKHDLNL